MTKCKVCGTKFTAKPIPYFNQKRGKTYLRQSKQTTCSNECADYARGSATRKPHGACSVAGCAYFGKLVRGFCRKHFQHFWRHGVPETQRRTPKPLAISESWKMWLAGVIDCEGWIGLAQQRRSTGIAYYGGVGVGNTNRKLTDKLLAITGLGYCMERPRPAPAKSIVQWMVTKRDEVDDLLVTIRPYLILKRDQADLLLLLPPIHAKDSAARAAIKAQLTILNRKGV